MISTIPFDLWKSLSPAEVKEMFSKAPFTWGLAAGCAIEQFIGKSIREHSDIDVVIFREDQLQLQSWLLDGRLYAADPPGTLRPWMDKEYLPFGIHDIWCHRSNSEAWQLQIMLMESEGEEWFSRRNRLVRDKRDRLLTM